MQTAESKQVFRKFYFSLKIETLKTKFLQKLDMLFAVLLVIREHLFRLTVVAKKYFPSFLVSYKSNCQYAPSLQSHMWPSSPLYRSFSLHVRISSPDQFPYSNSEELF